MIRPPPGQMGLMKLLWTMQKNRSSTLWNYDKDVSIDPITNSVSFKYKTSITGKTAIDGNTKEIEFPVSLKHLSNLWRTQDMPLISCEVSLTLNCSEDCVLADMTTQLIQHLVKSIGSLCCHLKMKIKMNITHQLLILLTITL